MGLVPTNWGILMKAFVSALALVLVASLQAQAQMAPEYYEIKSMKMEEVYGVPQDYQLLDQPGLGQDCNQSTEKIVGIFSDQAGSQNGNGLLDQMNVVVDQIINIGKKLWNIVLAGKPVVNLKMDTANALPKGLKCWVDLQGWQIPSSKVYRVTYENGFGADVVDFAFRVVYTHGGNLDGKGKYITNATMMPANIDVSWGFSFNAEATVPSVFNMATKENPVAGMQMNMKWDVESVIQTSKATETFFMGGDGQFKHMD
jgi:hypothetical protein